MKSSEKIILVVEDESPLRKALVEKFTHEGFKVFEAKNGKEGLEIALKEKPDLILLDIMMPVMDGTTMLGHLRTDDWGKTARVIMLTNLSDMNKIAEVVEKGSYDYLVKSDWKLEDVVKKVREKLSV